MTILVEAGWPRWVLNSIFNCHYICLTDIKKPLIFYLVIKSFKDRETEKIYNQTRSRKLPFDIQERALIKLMLIDSAEKEVDFKVPPSNHYEHL
jgi:hypothetical protein